MCALSEAADQLKSQNSGTIRLTAPTQTFYSKRLPDILNDFCDMHANVRFEFLPSNEAVDIAGGDVDVALRVAVKIDDPTLICRKLLLLTSSICASKRYGDKHGLPRSVADPKGHKFIVYDGPGTPIHINNWLLSQIDHDQIAMRVPSMNAMFTAIEMGAGIGPLPTSHLRPQNRMIRCFDPPAETAVTMWLLVNAGAYSRPEVKAFTSYFAPRFAAEMAKLEGQPGERA